MTILASTKELRRCVPADQQDRPAGEQLVYWLRTPTVYDRARLKRACTAAGARYPSQAERSACLARGIERLYAEAGQPEEAARLIALIEACAEQLGAAGEPLDGRDLGSDPGSASATGLEEIAEAERIVARHYPPYAELLGDLEHYREIVRLEAVRLLLVRAEGRDIGPPGPDGLPRAHLERLPPEHLGELALEALLSFAPSADEGNA